MSYEISGFLKMAEKDNWENGCCGEGYDTWIPYHLSAKTIPELKQQILDFVGAGADAMEINACDEAGRIDIQKTENDNGDNPTESEWEAFKSGAADLWCVTYSCSVEHVTRATVEI